MPAWSDDGRELGEEDLGSAHVFEHVAADDDVEVGGQASRQAVVEIGLVELVRALLHLGVGDDVDAHDVVAEGAQLLAQQPARAAQVEDSGGRTVHPVEDGAVRAVEGVLQRVVAIVQPS